MIKINRPSCPNLGALSNRNYKHPDNKEALKYASHDKCVYCESKVTNVYHGDIEHLKPKAKYPELTFNWDNLGFICAICNGNKSDIFDETFPFVNPYEDNPEDFLFALGSFIFHKGGDKRGEITVKTIKLNRPELTAKRLETIEKLKTLIDRYAIEDNSILKEILLDQIKIECQENKEYSLCALSLIKAENINI
jgi:uncharacterized protein (TIGR02646 family)